MTGHLGMIWKQRMADLMRDRVADSTWWPVWVELDANPGMVRDKTGIEYFLTWVHRDSKQGRKLDRIEWRSRPTSFDRAIHEGTRFRRDPLDRIIGGYGSNRRVSPALRSDAFHAALAPIPSRPVRRVRSEDSGGTAQTRHNFVDLPGGPG